MKAGMRIILSTILVAFVETNIADTPREVIAPQHYQANCIACHKQMISGDHTLLYTRSDRTIRNHTALGQRVFYCQNSLKLDWGKPKIDAVVQYLNQNFYHFE